MDVTDAADLPARPIRRQSSRDTAISLVQLEPLPIESPLSQTQPGRESPPGDTDELLLPDWQQSGLERAPATPNGTGTTGIGLSGTSGQHSRIFYLLRLQRYSSYAFSAFAALHLATTSLIPLAARSVPASESYLLLAREIYQTPLSEPLLVVLPAVVHVAAGLGIRLLRRRRNRELYGDRYPKRANLSEERGILPRLKSTLAALPYGWPPLSTISLTGYGFLAIFSAHAFMNRGLPLAVEGDSANVGLAFVAHGFARHPLLSWSSYAVLLTLGCGHMVWGWARWMGLAQRAAAPVMAQQRGVRAARRRQRAYWLAINGVAVAVAGLWAAGGLGVVARGGATQGWVGKLYDGLYEKVFFWSS